MLFIRNDIIKSKLIFRNNYKEYTKYIFNYKVINDNASNNINLIELYIFDFIYESLFA